MNPQQKTKGLVLGKFMPLHLGHLHLIEFGKAYCDQLTVVVDSQPGQPISGDRRVDWIRNEVSDIRIKHLSKYMPQYPEEHDDFWNVWKNELQAYFPNGLDFVFASEEYGWKLADVLGAEFVPVDPQRLTVSISGTGVRNSPLENWDYLPRSVRAYFAKRVCVFGPESTGKSTLTEKLAEHFDSIAVPEYARVHLESRNGEICYEDIEKIARGQLATEKALIPNCNKVAFCDTDLLLTTIWSDWLFKKVPDWIITEANNQPYDLYLVTDVDVPWVEDQIRYLPNERQSFLDRCRLELEKRDRKFVVLSGTWKERETKAIQGVESLLAGKV